MIVNSLAFLWFFLVVIVVYYLCQPKKQIQNMFLLACSYWFYAQVDFKMAGLLAGLTLTFWFLGRGIGKAIEQERERLASQMTTLSVVIGIGALFYFKYLNFFIGSFVSTTNAIGLHFSLRLTSIMERLNMSAAFSILPTSSLFSQLSFLDL